MAENNLSHRKGTHITRDVNIPLSAIARSISKDVKKKISMDIKEPNNILIIGLTDISRALYSTTAEYMFSSSIHQHSQDRLYPGS